MGVKGSVNTSIDVNELSSLIVFAKRYADEVEQASDEVRTLCRGMAEEESLKGGDGENFRAQFGQIATAYSNIDKSVQYITRTLNEKLKKALEMAKNSSSAASEDAAHQAATKAGVLKKE